MATWYKSGTVNVTNGSTAVVGVGTLWQLNGVTTGDLFTLDGDTFYEIAAVTGETAITLASNYGGTTQTGQTYAIIRNMTNTTNAELASKVSSLLNSWQTREDEFRAWHGGVANGGPGGDGRYPLTDALGNTQAIACPAKLADYQTTSGLLYAKLATTSNITLSGSQFIDLTQANVGDRVLVNMQTNAVENGLYVVQSGAWIRASDFNTTSAMTTRLIVVTGGLSQKNSVWLHTSTQPITVGTTQITFNRVMVMGSSSLTIPPGYGLAVNNSAFTVDGTSGDIGIGGASASHKVNITKSMSGELKARIINPITMVSAGAEMWVEANGAGIVTGAYSSAHTSYAKMSVVRATASSTAGLRFQVDDASAPISFAFGGTAKVHMKDGRFLVNTPVANDNGTDKIQVTGSIAASEGIKLGGGTNALNSYDPGTWVPVVSGSTTPGSNGYAVQVGRYTRIGRMVFFTATISLFSKDAAMSGQIRITGLPVSAAATGCAQGCDIGSVGGVTLATGYTMLTAQIDSGAGYIRLMQAGSGQFVNVIQAADVSATFAITISGSYEV